MYLNKVFIYGNLTRDPEMRALPSGQQVANFSIATNRVYKDAQGGKQEAVEYHNIVVFGRQAEVVGQYLKKGRPVLVEGRIQTRSYEKDGVKQYRTEIVADRFQFGPSGGMAGGGGQQRDAAVDTQPEGGSIEYPTDEINPEDIPF